MQGPITYRAFAQRVRRHRRTDVVQAVGAAAARQHMAELQQRGDEGTGAAARQFVLAGIARAALLHANDHREAGVEPRDLKEMANYYFNVEDPALGKTPGDDRLRGLLSRIAYEQFPFQFSIMENVGRTLPLLLDSMASCNGAPSPDDWRDRLGVDLEGLVRLAFVVFVAVVQNGGRIDRATLRMPHVAPVFTPLSPDAALEIVDRLFAWTPDQHKVRGLEGQVAGYEKWSFNPLLARPLVAIDDTLIAPAPRLILERVSPTGLYFDGVDAWGSAFTDSLGCGFENYVGRQLDHLEHADVHPEVTFGSPEQRTVDYFVVADEVVVLVEVKASRPVTAMRHGIEAADEDFVRKIGHAADQIRRTMDLLDTGHPAVGHIPRDRPVRGLIVTLEPFHLANTFLFEDLIPPPREGLAIASSHEVEGVVAALADRTDVGQRLLRALDPTPPTPPSLTAAAEDLDSGPNPMLDDAWRRFTAVFDGLRDAGA